MGSRHGDRLQTSRSIVCCRRPMQWRPRWTRRHHGCRRWSPLHHHHRVHRCHLHLHHLCLTFIVRSRRPCRRPTRFSRLPIFIIDPRLWCIMLRCFLERRQGGWTSTPHPTLRLQGMIGTTSASITEMTAVGSLEFICSTRSRVCLQDRLLLRLFIVIMISPRPLALLHFLRWSFQWF